MPDKISKLAAQLAQVQQQLKARAVAPQLGNSSLENKTLNQYTGDGTLGAQFGVLPDGTNGAGSFTGPNPPKPTQPSCSTIPGMIEARWNGKFVDALSPLDLRHVSVYVVPDGGTIDLSHAAGTVSGELGDAASIQMPIGTYQVYLVAWSLSGKWSAPSAPSTVVVPASIDLDSVTEAIDDLNETTGGLLTTAAELGTRLDTAETDLTTHDTRIADAETELTTAFGQISTVGGTATAAQAAAAAAAADAATAAGIANGKGKVLIQSTAPGAGDRNAVTLWIDTTGGTNTPKRWTTGTTWVAVTDKAATDAATAAAAAQGTATSAATAASTAQSAADAAAADAAAAAGIANGKGKVLIQSTAPGAADRNAVTLWIDTTGGANTPKRWSTGTTWVAVTDKAATDAASAAAAAQATATAAQTAAGTAQSTADGALTMAGTKSKVYYSTAAPSGSGTGAGDLWRQRNGTQEIIGEWQWSGSAWVSQTVSGSIVSNMDIGFLTAGSAVMSTALINKLVAGTANFQTADIKNLFVTTGTFTAAVINKIYADAVISRKLAAQYVAIGDFTNNVEDPVELGGTTLRGWAAGLILETTDVPAETTVAIKTTAGQGTWSVTTGGSTSPLFDVEPGSEVVFSMWIKSSVANTRYFQEIRDQAGAHAVTWSTIPGKASMTPGATYAMGGGVNVPTTWTKYWAKGVVKATATKIRLGNMYFNHSSGAATNGVISVAGVTIRRRLAGELIIDGSVTAASIAADAIDGKVITGATFQTSALPNVGLKFDSNGWRVYGPDGGEPIAEVRADGGTVYSVSDPATGEVLGALDSAGNGTFQDVSIAATARIDGVLVMGGDPLVDIALGGDDPGKYGPVLNGRALFGTNFTDFAEGHPSTTDYTSWMELIPFGVIANSWISSGAPWGWNGTGSQPHYRIVMGVTANLISGRGYMINWRCPPLHQTTTAGALTTAADIGGAFVRYSNDGGGISANNAGNILPGTLQYIPGGGTNFSPQGTTYVRCPEDIPAGKIMMGIEVYCYASRSMESVSNANANRWEISVADNGPRRALNDSVPASSSQQAADPPAPALPPAPDPVRQYTDTIAYSWFKSYKGDNSDNTPTYNGKVTQGYSSYAPSNGVMRGLVGFPSQASRLSGATVKKIEVYVYAEHWYANSGGTLCIGVHTQATQPTTWATFTNDVKRQAMKKPEGRWITLPSSVHAGFKSGSLRGISLLPPSSSTSSQYYGYLVGSKTKLRITYTK